MSRSGRLGRATRSVVRVEVAAATLATLLPLVYLLVWFNRFLGASLDGWFVFYAQQLLDGHVPYRDYYFFAPPGHILTTALTLKLFGVNLLAPHLLGLVERPLIGLLLYLWLRRAFGPPAALCGSVVAVIVMCGDIADPVGYYHQESVFWIVLAGFAAGRALAGIDANHVASIGSRTQPGNGHLWDSGRRQLTTGGQASAADDGRSRRSTRVALAWAMGAGGAAGAALCTKQTTGLGASAALVVLLPLLVAQTGGRPAGRRILCAYLGGWLLVIGALCLWLVQAGAFGPFLDQVFIHGPAAKGPLASVLVRPLVQTLTSPRLTMWLLLALLLISLAAPLWRRRSAGDAAEPQKDLVIGGRAGAHGVLSLGALGLGIGGCLTLGLILGGLIPLSPVVARTPQMVALYLAAVGALLIFAATSRQILNNYLPNGTALFGRVYGPEQRPATTFAVGEGSDPPDLRQSNDSETQRHLLLLAGVSVATTYMFSLSWAAFEPMVMPSLGLVVAFGVDRLAKRPRRSLGHLGWSLALMVLLVSAGWMKAMLPFSWGMWREPAIASATTSSRLPALAGFRLSPATVTTVEHVTASLQTHSSPDDRVFTFPHLPLFYTLAERRPPTFALVHWPDVTPDAIVEQDIEQLRAQPPAVLVLLELGEEQLQSLEAEFRHGQPSGQRAMMAALAELTAQAYRLDTTLPVPGSDSTIRIWVRHDR